MALERLVDHAPDVVLVRDVGPDAALGRIQIGDRDGRPLRREAVGDRRSDSLRAPGDERDAPLEPHFRGEKEVGIRMRFCCVCNSGWSRARKSFHRSSAWSSARRRSRSA